jgi:hypothetical protein
MPMRDERNERLDQLATRVGEVLNGEKLGDCALVCALIVARNIHDSHAIVDDRMVVLEEIYDFMLEQIDD